MSVRVPFSFTYKQYRDSKLATKFDKFCHSIMAVPVTILVFAVLIFYLDSSFRAIGVPRGIRQAVNGVLCVLMSVCFIGSFFSGRLCDRWRLSDKLALWDISGRKVSKRFKSVVAAAVVILLIPGAAALAGTAVSRTQADRYHAMMSALDKADGVAVTGVNIVSYDTDSGTYSTQYIPKHLRAQAPEDARYILKCTADAELIGVYGGIGGVGAYRRFVTVELVDRSSGKVIDSQRFDGSGPSNRISSDTKKSQYGSYPDEAEVSAWVDGIYQQAQRS